MLMKQIIIKFSIIIFLFLFLFMLVPSLMLADGWDIVLVDSGTRVGEYPSIDLDENGYPHISYFDMADENLKYAKWDGISWSTQTVDPSGYHNTVIEVDEANNPHIVYTSDSFDIRYASWTSSGWNIYSIDYVETIGIGKVDLILGTNGHIHISYYAGSISAGDIDLKYAEWDGIRWSTQTIDGIGVTAEIGKYSTIALNNDGNPRIAYTSQNDLLKYAKWTGISWSTETINDCNGYFPSLAIESATGISHIAYVDADNLSLQYVKWTGISWETETIYSGYVYTACCALALDKNGNPHVSYYPSQWTLGYASKEGGTWNIKTVDTSEYYSVGGRGVSIVIDEDDYANIAYCYSNVQGRLKYARWMSSPSDFSGIALSTGAIKWSWKDESKCETGYRVHTSTHGNISGNLTSNTTDSTEYNLLSNIQYNRHVNVFFAGEGICSNEDLIYTLSNPPTNLICTDKTANTISLSWSPGFGGNSRYAVERSLDGNPGTWFFIKEWEDNIAKPTLLDSGLYPNTSYWYRVRGYNGDGIITDHSNAVTVKTDNVSVIYNLVGGEVKITDDIGETRVEVSANALGVDGYVAIGLNPINTPGEVDPKDIIEANNKDDRDTSIDRVEETITEFNAYSLTGTRLTNSFGAKVTITIPYSDTNQDGIVDNTLPPINEKTLRIYVLNEIEKKWEFFGGIPNTSANTVSANVSHFSVYVLMGSPPSKTLDNAFAFPNPFKPEHTEITFVNLTAQATIKIFNIAGELVKAIENSGGDDRETWNTTNNSGKKVSSGVYIYLITDKKSKKKIGKLVIIR